MDATTPTPAPTSATTEKTSPAGQQGTATPPANAGERTFTQADLDRIVGERLTRAQQQATEQAEQARLAEEGKHKELSEQRATRIAELETRLQERDARDAATEIARGLKVAAPEKIFDLVKAQVTYADGKPANLETLIKDLLTAFPGLTASTAPASAGGPTNPARPGPAATADDDLDAWFSQRNRGGKGKGGIKL